MPPEVQTQISAENDAKAMRMAEINRKREELRRRMEEASKARMAKKGFMTPERKKKLRLLLRKKAAEELKKEQERKAEERRWIIEERCGEPEDLDWISKDALVDICEDYFQRIMECESERWDIEYEIRRRAAEISDLTTKVNDLRGKFQKPILRKVSKYDSKFAKLQRKAAEFNYRNQLKIVKRHDIPTKEEEKKHGDKYSEKDEESITVAEEPAPKSPEERTSVSPVSIKSDRLSEIVEERFDAEASSSLTEGEPRLKSQSPQQGDPRLGGESPREGEQEDGRVSGGQSPEGEVQPAELPPTPQPQHTEEDLWDYLREHVTSEHPSTVAEFVQNLIGTLQHVPEEYLKPVIDANIKRVNSPTVTDGEHRPSPEGIRPGEEAPLEGALSEDIPVVETEATLAVEREPEDEHGDVHDTLEVPQDAEPFHSDAEEAEFSAVEASA